MKTFRKRLASLSLAMVLCLSLAACGGNGETTSEGEDQASTETTVLKLGHVFGSSAPINIALETMAEEVYEKTEGRYKIELYPSSALGGESDLIEGVQIGTVDMVYTASTPLANSVPKLAALDLPYLINDYEHADAVFFDPNSSVRATLMGYIDDAGYKTLTLVENGFRQLMGNKEVTSLADMKGMKIRVMENPLHIELWESLGASPTPMSASECMTGLQQGTVDAVEMFYSVCISNGFHELCDYYAGTNHIYTCGVLMMNAGIWENMTDEDKAVFDAASLTVAETTNAQLRAEDQAHLDTIIEGYAKAYHELDQAELQAAVEGMYDNHPEYADIVAEIKSLAK